MEPSLRSRRCSIRAPCAHLLIQVHDLLFVIEFLYQLVFDRHRSVHESLRRLAARGGVDLVPLVYLEGDIERRPVIQLCFIQYATT